MFKTAHGSNINMRNLHATFETSYQQTLNQSGMLRPHNKYWNKCS